MSTTCNVALDSNVDAHLLLSISILEMLVSHIDVFSPVQTLLPESEEQTPHLDAFVCTGNNLGFLGMSGTLTNMHTCLHLITHTRLPAHGLV